MAPSLSTLFSSFENYKVLIIGDVMIDSYLWGKVDRISPEAPVPIISMTNQENRLGGAANVALNIQALGATPILCAIVGNDANAATFKNLLKDSHITDEGIVTDPSRMTTIKTRVISGRQHLLRVDRESDKPISKEVETTFVSHIISLLDKYKVDALIFEDYDKGAITPHLIKQVVDAANSRNIPSLVDPKKRNFLDYNGVTLFKPNFKELTEGLKLEVSKTQPDQLFDAAKLLHQKGIKYVLITLSEHGVFISNGSSFKQIPAEIRDISDVSGAGDTVISVASLCMASKLDHTLTAQIANIAGGLVCEKVGVVPVDKPHLMKELSQKGILL